MANDSATSRKENAAAPLTPPLRGYFDGCRNGIIAGWAFLTAQPEEPVTLTIHINGKPVGTTKADLKRQDLLAKNIGNGMCAFRFPVPQKFMDGGDHMVNIICTETGRKIPGCPRAVSFSREASAVVTALPQQQASSQQPNVGALVGKEGWYFLVNDTNKCLDQYRGLLRFGSEEIRAYNQIFAERQKYFSEKRIPYLFAVVPGKESVYREFLPAGIERHREGLPLDQLIKASKFISGFKIIDLRAALISNKQFGQLYYKADAHWNHAGAYFAYAHIMNELKAHFPKIAPLPLEQFETKEISRTENDLERKEQFEFKGGNFIRAAEQKALFTEKSLQFVRKGGFKAKYVKTPEHLKVSKTRETVVFEQADKNLPTAVVFRDSFGDWIIPFLSEHFRRVVYVWQSSINKKVIETEKPDVVIHLAVDRFLMRLPKE